MANEEKPAITETLVLVTYTKQKGTEDQPGYKIKLLGPLPSIGRDNESEAKKPKHGLLKLTNRTMFEGTRSVTMTGKLKRRFVAGHKDNPGFQVWDFRLANVPTLENANILHELARANGDEVQAEVEAAFTETEEDKRVQVSEGPELFGDEEAEIERIKNMDAQGFDGGAEANVLSAVTAAANMQEKARKGRKRKVTV